MNKKATNSNSIIKNLLPTFLIILFIAIIFIGGLNKPFIGYHDWNNVVYGASARSLLGKSETEEIFYQQNYPIMLPATLAASMLVFGINEFSIRIVAVFFTFLASLMIFFFTRKLYNWKAAAAAAVFFLSTPLIRYFGKISVHETVVPFFSITIFYLYWNWYKKNTFRNYIYLLAVIFIGQQFGWPVYFTIPLISIHYFLFFRKRKISAVLNLWLISFFSFLLFLLTDWLIKGRMPFNSLWNIFVTRLAFNKEDPYTSFTFFQFLKKELLWIRVYLTRVLSLFALGGIIWQGWLILKKRLKPKNTLLLFLGIYGCMYLLIFRQAAWLHDYVIIYLFPFLSIVAALFVVRLSQWFKIAFFIPVALIIALMFFESRQFLFDLERASDFYSGYELGIYLNKKMEPKRRFFLASKEASKLYGVFLYFYADRIHISGEPSLDEFIKNKADYEKNYIFFVIDEAHNYLSPEITPYLESQYQSEKVGNFLLFKLNNHESSSIN